MRVHMSKYGTHHPDQKEDVAWATHDVRGYIDPGVDCEECGAKDLSFAFVCLDGGDTLCEECFKKEGGEVVPCDCE